MSIDEEKQYVHHERVLRDGAYMSSIKQIGQLSNRMIQGVNMQSAYNQENGRNPYNVLDFIRDIEKLAYQNNLSPNSDVSFALRKGGFMNNDEYVSLLKSIKVVNAAVGATDILRNFVDTLVYRINHDVDKNKQEGALLGSVAQQKLAKMYYEYAKMSEDNLQKTAFDNVFRMLSELRNVPELKLPVNSLLSGAYSHAGAMIAIEEELGAITYTPDFTKDIELHNWETIMGADFMVLTRDMRAIFIDIKASSVINNLERINEPLNISLAMELIQKLGITVAAEAVSKTKLHVPRKFTYVSPKGVPTDLMKEEIKKLFEGGANNDIENATQVLLVSKLQSGLSNLYKSGGAYLIGDFILDLKNFSSNKISSTQLIEYFRLSALTTEETNTLGLLPEKLDILIPDLLKHTAESIAVLTKKRGGIIVSIAKNQMEMSNALYFLDQQSDQYKNLKIFLNLLENWINNDIPAHIRIALIDYLHTIRINAGVMNAIKTTNADKFRSVVTPLTVIKKHIRSSSEEFKSIRNWVYDKIICVYVKTDGNLVAVRYVRNNRIDEVIVRNDKSLRMNRELFSDLGRLINPQKSNISVIEVECPSTARYMDECGKPTPLFIKLLGDKLVL